MVKINLSIASIMGDPNLSITSSPFAPDKVIIKRASFPKGIVPRHLESYLIGRGECAGRVGKTIGPRGQPIPQTAACVAEKHKRGGGKRAGRRARAEE